jgi:peptide/nickel transport system substrate-binding protein
MKKYSLLAAFSVMLVFMSVMLLPVIAQETVDLTEGLEFEEGAAGEGGIIYDYNAGTDDPATFNPLLASDTFSATFTDFLYPPIFTINPLTGQSEPNLPGGLATGWSYDETGTVLTITLRQDAFWNDGTPVTSADYVYAANAVRSGQIDSPRTSVFETMADGTPAGGKVVSIEAPDDYTVVVTFSEADCIAFEDVNDISTVPAHVFSELYGEDYAKMMDDPRTIPTVSFGPFKDIELEPGARVSLIADQSYPDALLGYVSPSEYSVIYVPDENVATERFIAGDLTILPVPSTRQQEIRDNGTFPYYEFTANGFTFFAFNHADPKNPQPGLDENGNVIPQTPHPVLGDVRVRQAITMAVNVDDILTGIRSGNGVKVATHTIPTSWVYDPEMQFTFDVEAAKALLTEAGWVDDDNDESTPRVCQGCKYAVEVDESFEGSPLTLKLRVPAGGAVASQIGEFFDASLTSIGFDADFAAIDWGSAFLPELDGQIFDMALLSWSLGLPVDPDMSWVYGPEVDVPGSGFNFGSFYNAELNDLLAKARNPSETNGCDQATRREIYLQAQQIVHDELPYFYLYVAESMTAVQPYLKNWNPSAYSRVWTTDAWIAQP